MHNAFIEEVKELGEKAKKEIDLNFERLHIISAIKYYGNITKHGIKTVRLSKYDKNIIKEDRARVMDMEYIDAITLGSLLSNISKGRVSEKEIKHIKKVIKNLIILYLNHIYFGDGFYHADLHPDNIIAGKDGSLTIIDYGYAATTSSLVTNFDENNNKLSEATIKGTLVKLEESFLEFDRSNFIEYNKVNHGNRGQVQRLKKDQEKREEIVQKILVIFLPFVKSRERIRGERGYEIKITDIKNT